MLYFFFRECGKKNTADFTHSLLFPGYPAKSNFSGEKKKYDTFELTSNFTGKSLSFFFEKKMNPEILPQIYREISLQNFSKEKSL